MIVKRAASAFNLLLALWTLYVVVSYMNTPSSCPSGGCPVGPDIRVLSALLATGVLLLIDSGIGFTDRWLAFPAGVALSLVAVVLVALQWNAYGLVNDGIVAALAIAAVVLDIIAMFSRVKLSEQSHPLNLPVFG